MPNQNYPLRDANAALTEFPPGSARAKETALTDFPPESMELLKSAPEIHEAAAESQRRLRQLAERIHERAAASRAVFDAQTEEVSERLVRLGGDRRLLNELNRSVSAAYDELAAAVRDVMDEAAPPRRHEALFEDDPADLPPMSDKLRAAEQAVLSKLGMDAAISAAAMPATAEAAEPEPPPVTSESIEAQAAATNRLPRIGEQRAVLQEIADGRKSPLPLINPHGGTPFPRAGRLPQFDPLPEGTPLESAADEPTPDDPEK
jgi:hypothetical protein